jgi:hypothetical protein
MMSSIGSSSWRANKTWCVLKSQRLLAGESPVLVRGGLPGSGQLMQASLNLFYFQAVRLLWNTSFPEEPGAIVPHAGICAGAVG